MKKQIWVETNELNDYLKDGWTHIFRQDGTLLSRLCGTMKEYYLLEKEEVKDTEETLTPEESRMFFLGRFLTSIKTFEVCGSTERLNDFRDFIDETNKKLSPHWLNINEVKALAKDWGLKVINEEER